MSGGLFCLGRGPPSVAVGASSSMAAADRLHGGRFGLWCRFYLICFELIAGAVQALGLAQRGVGWRAALVARFGFGF